MPIFAHQQQHQQRYSVTMTMMIIVIISSVLSINVVFGYPDGAPSSTCGSMMPVHGASARTSSPPYTIATSATTYTPGSTITVTVSGSSQFKGLLLLGRATSDSATVGTFSAPSSSYKLQCSGQGITQTNKNQRSTASFIWTAPSTSRGSIYFVATVVQSTSTFWTNVRSITVTDASTTTLKPTTVSSTSLTSSTTTTSKTPSSTPTSTSTSTKLMTSTSRSRSSTVSSSSTSTPRSSLSQSLTTPSTSILEVINTSTCNTDKSCFRSPSNCVSNDCRFALTWSYDGKSQSVSFELESVATSMNYYVAFALSTDKLMGSDSVVQCVYDDNTNAYKVQASQNVGYRNSLLNNDQLGLVPGSVSAGYVNGRIVCRFQRLINVGNSIQNRRRRQAGVDTVFPLDTGSYYILIAYGPASGGAINFHDARYSSDSQINFTTSSPSTVNGVSQEDSPKRKLIKVHGILMVMAWMVFASFGMLMPRYCKSAWPDTKWYGKMIWFQIHQPCMVLTLILTSAGFVVIFYEAQTYLDLSLYNAINVAHAPLGTIVMALVLINPIMSIFRCEPKSKNRRIFNVLHFLVGELAHVAAVVTIFLGLYTAKLGLPLWTKGVMAAFICYHVLIEAILAIHMHSDKIVRKKHAYEISMTEMNAGIGNFSKLEKNNTSSTFYTVVLAAHLNVVLGMGIAISVQIGLS